MFGSRVEGRVSEPPGSGFPLFPEPSRDGATVAISAAGGKTGETIQTHQPLTELNGLMRGLGNIGPQYDKTGRKIPDANTIGNVLGTNINIGA